MIRHDPVLKIINVKEEMNIRLIVWHPALCMVGTYIE